jgi:hypothetical protein
MLFWGPAFSVSIYLFMFNMFARSFRRGPSNALRSRRVALGMLTSNRVVGSHLSSALLSRGRRVNFFQLTALAAMASASASASASSSVTVAKPPVEYFRKDYKPSDFAISDIFLSFQLEASDTTVVASSKVFHSSSWTAKSDLVLDGEELNILSVKVADKVLSADQYSYADGKLTIVAAALPQSSPFDIETSVKIHPDKNLALSGLYKSGSSLLCTQCEAMGFRRIAFHMGTFVVYLSS